MTSAPAPLRVLHVLRQLRFSGAEVMLVRAAGAWRERGITGEVVATAEAVGEYGPTMEAAGYRIHHLPFRKSPAFFSGLRTLVRDGEFDAVHVHLERASTWVCLTARSACPVVVRTIHNVFEYEGGLRRRRRLQRRLLRQVGVRMVAVGPSVARNESERLSNRVLVVPNWIDTQIFRPPTEAERVAARKRFGVPEGALAIVSIGNCGRQKNHESLLTALARVENLGEWIYLHAGEERPGTHDRELATELGIAERCRFLGHTDAVRDLLHAADVYAMPSRFEGMSAAALEALSTGVVALFADVPGLRDLKALDAAHVWTTTEPASIADGIAEAAALAESNGPGSRQAHHEAVASLFAIERGASMYADLYRGAPVGSVRLG